MKHFKGESFALIKWSVLLRSYRLYDDVKGPKVVYGLGIFIIANLSKELNSVYKMLTDVFIISYIHAQTSPLI